MILEQTAARQTKLLSLLRREFGLSAGLVKRLKWQNALFVNGAPAHTDCPVQPGDRVRVVLEEQTEGFDPEPMPLSILYEDEDILVINKPAHMPVHPSMTHYEHTLSNAVFYYLGSKNEAGPFRCINRLDKDTTGITILAKNSLSGGILGRQMNERKIHRTYLAIVRGITPESGTITAPIGRKEGSVLERQVDFGQGEYACTHYRRLAVK